MFICFSIKRAKTPLVNISFLPCLDDIPSQGQALRVMAAVVSILILAATAGAAAAGRSRVEGSVSDPSGAKIIGARVMLRDKAGRIAYQTETAGEGRFSIDDVAGGHYTVIVEASGFAQARETSVDVRVGEIESLSILLDLAAISDNIVITATRTNTPSNELGGSVSVVTGQELQLYNQASISESLRIVPGLVVAQTGGRGGITSVFVRGGKSDYNKVLIDGVPVNAPGGLFDYASLTPENVDRIEVARGPRSALFGSDAMTSVIQLFTKRGSTSTPELELSGEGGSFGFHRETARLSGVAARLDYSASFGFQSTGGRFENNDFINRSASSNFGFRVNEQIDLRVTSRMNNNTRGVPGPTAVLFRDPDDRLKHHDIAVGAGLDWQTSSRWRQTARFVYSEFETHSFDPVAQDLARPDTPPAAPGSFVPDFAFSFADHERRAGFQYQSILALGASGVITGGVDFEHERAVFTADFSRVSPSRNNLGAYVQSQVSMRERLFVTAGVRVERNKGKVPEDLRAVLASLGSSAPAEAAGFGVAANPKLAASLVLRPAKGGDVLGATRIRASFGTGIKEPRLDEAFSPSPFFVGNPALDPERATSFDLGASQELFNRRGSVDITYFDNRFRDIIIFTFDPLTFGPIRLSDGRLTNLINLERASARGVELIGAARPLRQLRAAASYTFLNSRLDRAAASLSPEIGLSLIRRARHSGTLEVSWIAERFDVSLDGSFVGKRRECDPVTCAKFDPSGRPFFTDGYARVNASGSYHFNKSVIGFARVENILNQDYQEVLGYPAYRLTFSAGVRIRVGGGR
jgi:vitamin B12 transporter